MRTFVTLHFVIDKCSFFHERKCSRNGQNRKNLGQFYNQEKKMSKYSERVIDRNGASVIVELANVHPRFT